MVVFLDEKDAAQAVAHFEKNTFRDLPRLLVLNYRVPNLSHKSFAELRRERDRELGAMFKHPPLEDTSSTDHVAIAGLTLLEDFIDEEEEKALLSAINTTYSDRWESTIVRRVQHYGFEYDYLKRRTNVSRRKEPLPGACVCTSVSLALSLSLSLTATLTLTHTYMRSLRLHCQRHGQVCRAQGAQGDCARR